LDCDVFRNCSDCFVAAVLISEYIDGFFLMRRCQMCIA